MSQQVFLVSFGMARISLLNRIRERYISGLKTNSHNTGMSQAPEIAISSKNHRKIRAAHPKQGPSPSHDGPIKDQQKPHQKNDFDIPVDHRKCHQNIFDFPANPHISQPFPNHPNQSYRKRKGLVITPPPKIHYAG